MNSTIARQGSPNVLALLLGAFLFASYAGIDFLVSMKIGAITMAVAALYLLIRRDRPWSTVYAAMFLFVLQAGLSVFYAPNSFTAYRLALIYLPHAIISMGIALVMSHSQGAKYFLASGLLTVLYVAVIAIANGGVGPGGYVGDENDTALVAIMALPFALFALDSQSKTRRLYAAGLTILFVACVVSTLSRGGIVALAAVLGYYWIAKGRSLKTIIVLIIGLGIFSIVVPDEFVQEAQSIRTEVAPDAGAYSTGQQRLYLWATATNIFLGNPILGVGPGNFPWVAEQYRPKEGDWPSGLLRRNWFGIAPHSFFFTLLAEFGALGSALVGFLVWRFFRKLRHLKEASAVRSDQETVDMARYLASSVMGSMIGFLAGGVFLAVLAYPHFWYLIGMGVGIERLFHIDQNAKARRLARDGALRSNQ